MGRRKVAPSLADARGSVSRLNREREGAALVVRALALGLACAALAGVASSAGFRAGAHVVDATPREFPIRVSGGFLAGTADRATGRLTARAIAMDDGERRVVIAVADSLMMPREMLDRVKQAAARSTGIPTSHMLISATHTHSAPPAMGALGTDAEPSYTALLEAKLVEAIEGAVRNLTPARAGWAVVDVPDLTHCRRWILRPDRMRKDPFGDISIRANMHPGYQNPDFVGPAGPSDPGLTVLAFQSADGRPIAMLANYSMHYVGGGRGISPDYYGPFVDTMERRVGASGFVALISQGTSGDQHWMDYSKPKQEFTPEDYAEKMAQSAYDAFRGIRYSDRVTLGAAESRLRLKRRVPSPERLAWARQIAAQMSGPPKNQQEVYAREQIYLHEEPERELRLQALRIGGLGIAALPNEVFAITGLKLKAQSPLEPTFNIELANGADGYIPPPEQHHLGGYTTWPARTAALEPGAEPKIVEALLLLLEQVSGKHRREPREEPGAYAKAVLRNRPAAYWRGEEWAGPVARDASGNSRAARYEPGVVFYLEGPASPAFSDRINRAPQFAGGRLAAQLPPGRRYSLELWFQNALPVDARAVTGYIASAGPDRIGIGGTAASAGKLFLESGPTRLEGSTLLEIGRWNHLVIVRNGERVALYLNGGTIPEVGGAAPAAAGETKLYIGGADSQESRFEGRIDEIAVWGRALDAESAAAHFRAAGLKR